MEVNSMTNQKIEFKEGDIVTYYPYESEHKAKVVDVSLFNFWGKKDGKVYYTLTGTEYIKDGKKKHSRVKSVTSGQCIKESTYFKKYCPTNKWK